jgi:WD40 repeat protein
VAWAEGLLRVTPATRLAVTATLPLAAGVALAGAGALAHRAAAPSPGAGHESPQRPAGAAAGRPKPPQGKPARLDRHGDPLPQGAVARLGTVRFRHGSHIYSVAFTPDGAAVVTGSLDHTVRVWDTATGKELRCFQNKDQDQVLCVACAPDGKTIAAGGVTGLIGLWDRATGAELHQLEGHGGNVLALAFSPDGKALASAGWDHTVRLWDVARGKAIRQLRGHRDEVHAVAFSPDGKLLASGSKDKSVRLWDPGTGKELRRLGPAEKEVYCLAFSPDGKLLASGGGDKAVRLWDPASGQEVRRLGVPYPGLTSLAFSPDGRTLAAASLDCGSRPYIHFAGRVTFWEVSTGKVLPQCAGDRYAVGPVAYSPDGKTLAAGGAQDSTLHLWDLATGRERHRAGHHSEVTSVAFTADGRGVVTAGCDETVRVWEPATGRELRQLAPGHWLWVSRDGQTQIAVTGCPDRTVQVRDATTGQERRRFPLADREYRYALSPDGRTLAAGGGPEGTVHLWDVSTGRRLRRLEGQRGSLYGLAFSPDGKALASAAVDKARLWDVATGKELQQIAPPCSDLAFSPDGRLLASAGWDGTIRLRDTATGQEVRALPGPGSNSVCFSPDGRTLAAGFKQGWLRLWEVATGQERRRFEGHRGSVDLIAFSPEGRLLATGSSDTTALVWDLGGVFAEGGAPSAGALNALWADLAGADAARAYRAVWRLALTPGQAVPFLKGRLRPAMHVDQRRVAGLIADLDHDSFAVREEATQALEGLGDSAGPLLRKALAGSPSAEVRRRLQQVLERLDAANASERLRMSRALEALEAVGTPAARGVLEALARGGPEAALTQEAKASLGRLTQRATPKP